MFRSLYGQDTAVTDPLTELLAPYGGPARVVDLRQRTPDSIQYLDLTGADRRALPDAVVESAHEPLAYVVDGAMRPDDLDLPLLRKTVVLRGDAPYLMVLEPGRLKIYEASLSSARRPSVLEVVYQEEERARTTFHRLSQVPAQERQKKFIHDLLFGLLTKAIDHLWEQGIERDDAVSLVGRALFTRFLIDRKILGEAELSSIQRSFCGLTELFSGPQRTRTTCEWLDRTFNGDFLPLSFTPRGFEAVPAGAFDVLEDILHISPGGQLLLDWGDLNFAHVPVGLLSQVYEQQAEKWNPVPKRREGVYYTPRRIAELMVREVFSSLEQRDTPPDTVRILDPAVGAGVFLVSAFQEIVAARWRRCGVPPGTREIRSILYGQLAGFDISEPALQLAALSLYLKAIELDPDPHPPEKLRFDPLRGTVLWSVREEGHGTARFVAGSLGPSVDASHRGRYDLVIGNPPWTALEGEDGRAVYARITETVRPLAAARLGLECSEAFTLPDLVPDLPFVWRAMEWAKAGGWIAFALHGRLLFKLSEQGRKAREDLFRALEVTGILNGADLRKTKVWPGVDAPFCLLFARNRPAEPDHAFSFVSPYLEENLNRQGRLRIDSQAAHPVEVRRALTRPELLKVLYRGTSLDAGVLEKIRRQNRPTLLSYFDEKGLAHGQGYQIGARARPVPKELIGLPELLAGWEGPIRIDPQALPRFKKKILHRPRRPEIYRRPLMLVRKSPPADAEAAVAFGCSSDLVYCESYYGYSTAGHPEAETLSRYLLILLHSRLFLWHALMTSSELGIERECLQKDDVDDFPFQAIEDLPDHKKDGIGPLSEELLTGGESELDAWVAGVYGLDRWDQEVIRDTLAVSLPYPQARANSQRPPVAREVEAFVARIEKELRPFARAAGKDLRVSALKRTAEAPWEVLLLESGRPKASSVSWEALGKLFQRADQEGASQLVVAQPGHGRLLLGVLRQYRYWTPTRARLAALELIEEHLAALFASV